MIYTARTTFILFLAFLLQCCIGIEQKKDSRPLARVGDQFLYQSELKNVVPNDVTLQDSLVILHAYINKWIQDRLLIKRAELNLKSEQKDFENQINDYRNSLLIYSYQNEYIKQKLDTTVTDEEIEAYYNENNDNFRLTEPVVKSRFVKISKQAHRINDLRRIYASEEEVHKQQVEEYCHQFSSDFYLDDQEWIEFSDLITHVPINTDNVSKFLKRYKSYEAEDATSFYFLKIIDFKETGDIIPLQFERKKIKSIIINQRKINLIAQMKEGLYKEAEKKKEFEIY